MLHYLTAVSANNEQFYLEIAVLFVICSFSEVLCTGISKNIYTSYVDAVLLRVVTWNVNSSNFYG